MTNLELVRAFFAGAPDDLVAAVEDPEWVELARAGLEPRIEEFSDVASAHAAAAS